MPPPKRQLDTRDLKEAQEEARFQAEVLAGMADLKKDNQVMFELLERYGVQIQTLNTKDTLRERDLADANRRADSFDIRLRTVESTPAEVRLSAERIETAVKQLTENVKRDFDNAFLRIRALEDGIKPFDHEKWRKWTEDGIPALRIGKWGLGILGGGLILLALKVFFGG